MQVTIVAPCDVNFPFPIKSCEVLQDREVKRYVPRYATYESIIATMAFRTLSNFHLRNLELMPLVLVAVLLPYTSVKIRPLMVTTVPVC